MNIPGYDDRILRGPDDDRTAIGIAEGETCGRVSPPDEVQPRGYRPKPCDGMMEGVGGFNCCTVCGVLVDELDATPAARWRND